MFLALEPEPSAREVDESEVAARGLFVSRGHGAIALEVVNEDLDEIALSLESPDMAALLSAARASNERRPSAHGRERLGGARSSHIRYRR